jgi:capsular exopolysaccharide synthesis family protein
MAAAAGSLVYYFFEPQYTASRWIYIAEEPEELLPTHRRDGRRFVENQVAFMRSPYLLQPLLSKPEIAETPELIDQSDRLAALQKLLKVQPVGRSEYYSIEFTSTSPVKAALIVNEVAEAYISKHRLNNAEEIDKMIGVLIQEQKIQEERISKLKGDAKVLAQSLNQVSPLERGDPNTRVRPADATLAGVQTELVTAEVEAVVRRAELETLEKLAQEKSIEVPQVVVEQELAVDEELARLRGVVLARQARRDQIAAALTEKARSTNASFLQAEAELAKAQAELQARTDELRPQIAQELAQSARVQRDAELAARKERLAAAELRLQRLRELHKEAAAKTTQASGDAVGMELLLMDYDHANAVRARIAEHITALNANQKVARDRVQELEKAEPPAMPKELVPFKKLGMVAGVAFLVPFALAVAWEYFFRRVNSRQQLESTGPLKVVGEITALPRRAGRRGDSSARVSRELQLFEESIDGLRTYLSLVNSLQGLRVLAVTSAVSREGKTSVAAQLAVSIAGATGEPTLLIDGDLRSPDIHRVFDVDLSPGLAEVLAGTISEEDAIETDFNELLHLMTAGKLTTSPHRLLGNGEFRALIERLRGVYKHIIIDTPPLLPASEALVIARASDATILSARRDYSRLDQVTEAYQRLHAAGVAFAGVVLNGIPIRHYAYKYGTYGYRRRLAAAE